MKNIASIFIGMLLHLSLFGQGAEEGVGADPAKFLRTIESTTQVAGLGSERKLNNDLSVRPIRDEDVMFSIRLWSDINLNEKINAPWDAKESRFVELIFQGVEAYFQAKDDALETGAWITPYGFDELNPDLSSFTDEYILTRDQFNDKLVYLKEGATNYDEADRQGDRAAVRRRPENTGQTLTNEEVDRIIDQEFNSNQYNTLDPLSGDFDRIQVEEDLYFDRNLSVARWDISSLTIMSPPIANDGAANIGLVKLKFQEVKKYIDMAYACKLPEQQLEGAGCRLKDVGYWYNTKNPRSKDISFIDAFDLRLFSSYIVKFQNVDDAKIESFYGKSEFDYSIIEMAMKKRFELLEKMHNLWEY